MLAFVSANRVTEESLLAALAERPSDDDTRAVLADWLEEQGRPHDADLVRAVLVRRAMHAGAAEVVACSRALELLAASSAWPGREIALYDPSVRAQAHPVIDPPWTRFEPLRL